MKRICLFFSLLSAAILWYGCSPASSEEPQDPEEEYYTAGREYVDEMFSFCYWWCDKVPSSVTWNRDFYDYFDGHLVPEDRWSWMETGDEWRDSESGTVSGSYGAVYSQPLDYGDYDIYVSYVLLGSPMYRAGVRRGWRLDGIGGYSVSDLIQTEEGIETLYTEMDRSSNRYVFMDSDGLSHDLSLSASTISTHTYLDYRIFTSADYPGLDHSVAYFNYWTFVSALESDITDTFGQFKTAGVRDLILDLRYNGGGSTDALRTLVGCIAPGSLDGKTFSVITHNKYMSSRDEEEDYEISSGTLSLDRIFVITGSGTASASEVLINGLRDGLGKQNVITVGDTTYGKPNGMYAFAYPEGADDDYYKNADYVFLPICFYSCNSAGEQIPDGGFPPVKYSPDDLYHDWGVQENRIRLCLSYIATGAFDDGTKAGRTSRTPGGTGLRISSPEDAEGYGRLTAVPPMFRK